MTRARAALIATLACSIVAADFATKQLVVTRMTEGESIPVIEGVLHWTFVRNPGAAFSLFTGVPWLFTIAAFAVAAWIVATINRPRTTPMAVALAFILGGAAGNLVDRVFRAPAPFRGHVVDFVDLRVWPTFNIADSAVVCGALLLVVASWREERAMRQEASEDAP